MHSLYICSDFFQNLQERARMDRLTTEAVKRAEEAQEREQLLLEELKRRYVCMYVCIYVSTTFVLFFPMQGNKCVCVYIYIYTIGVFAFA